MYYTSYLFFWLATNLVQMYIQQAHNDIFAGRNTIIENTAKYDTSRIGWSILLLPHQRGDWYITQFNIWKEYMGVCSYILWI